jgi:hypothetical protein
MRIKRFIIFLLISLISAQTGILVCYFTAEKYFFDKFFYGKSPRHGYITKSSTSVYDPAFGVRGKDLRLVEKIYGKRLTL